MSSIHRSTFGMRLRGGGGGGGGGNQRRLKQGPHLMAQPLPVGPRAADSLEGTGE